jgi:hypothetical protein
MLEVGRKARRIGAQALLQPFAHGVTDRSARLVIDPFIAVGDSAVHGRFRLARVSISCCTKSLERHLFRAMNRLHGFVVKIS